MNETAGVLVLGFAVCVLTAALILLGVLVVSHRQEQKRLQKVVFRRQDYLEASVRAITKRLTATAQPSAVPVISPRTPGQGVPISNRAKILKQLELGETPEQISGLIGVPVATIRMVLAVDKRVGKRLEAEKKSA